MPIYFFEIQNSISIEVEASSAEQARNKLVNNPSLFKDKMVEDCYISDGRKVI